MPVVLAVAAGGALGAAGRYGLDRLIERRSFAVFPWSTFTINVSGPIMDSQGGIIVRGNIQVH